MPSSNHSKDEVEQLYRRSLQFRSGREIQQMQMDSGYNCWENYQAHVRDAQETIEAICHGTDEARKRRALRYLFKHKPQTFLLNLYRNGADELTDIAVHIYERDHINGGELPREF